MPVIGFTRYPVFQFAWRVPVLLPSVRFANRIRRLIDMLHLKTIRYDAVTLPVVIIYLPYGKKVNKRHRVILHNTPQTVEVATQSIFVAEGYQVIKGTDIQLAGVFLYEKYGVDQLMKSARELLKKEKGMVAVNDPEIVRVVYEIKTVVNPETVTDTPSLMRTRWRYFSDNHNAGNMLYEVLKGNQGLTEKWIEWRKTVMPYGGEPDLFVYHPESGEWSWVEVKSDSDALQAHQWVWIESFIRMVAPNVIIFSIEDANKNEYMKANEVINQKTVKELDVVNNDIWDSMVKRFEKMSG